MSQRTWTDALRLTGSRWATTPAYWLFALIALGVTSTVLLGAGRTDVSWWSVLTANALATVAALAGIGLIRQLAPNGFPAALSVPLGAAVGLVRGVTLYIALGLFNSIPLDVALIAQLATPAMVQCALIMPACGVVGASIARWSERRDELVRQRTAQRVARQRELGRAAPEQVTSFLHVAHKRLESSSDDELASQLRQLADVDVREFSRDLWGARGVDIPPFTMSELLKLAIIEHRFPALALGAFGFVQMLFVQAYFVGFTDSLWRSALQGTVIAAVYAAGARVRTTTLLAGGTVFLSTIVMMTAAVFTMSYRWFPVIPGFLPLRPLVASFVVSALVSALAACAVTAGIRLAHTIRSEQLAIADQLVTEVVSARVRRIQEHEAARLLHGDVQRSLRALAHTLAQSGDAPSVRALAERALSQAEQQLAFGMADAQPWRSLPEMLSECASRWAGLVQVEYQIRGQSESLLGDEIDTLAELLNEAVSNAHRHGGASQLRAEISVDERAIHASFVDTGERFIPAPAGLGSALFDGVTAGAWQLERNGSDIGCTLKFTISRAAQG